MRGFLRLLRWPLAIALVALPVIALVNGWAGAARWPLRTLSVTTGLQRVDTTKLRAVVLPYAQRGFFAVDLDAVRQAVTKLPWVERVEVRKHWPDVLEVRIVEHRPFARWGERQLVSEHGRLFPAGTLKVPSGLPLLDGPKTRVAEVMALYQQASREFAADGGVRGVVLDARESWTVTLVDGTRLILGRDDPQQRLARFAPMLPRLEQLGVGQRIVHADLRYTNGFALQWAKLPKPSDDARTAAKPTEPSAASLATEVPRTLQGST